MPELSDQIVENLRRMAAENASVSQLLRETLRRMPSDQQRKIELMIYFRLAFHLPLASVAPIGGWDENGQGEINDERIESLLGPEILRTKELWESSKHS